MNRGMSKKSLIALSLLALCAVLLAAGTAQSQAKRKLSMGTGTIGGLYYIFGGTWAKALNEAVPDVEVTAESTPGSVANAQLIQAGKMALGFSQATAFSASRILVASWFASATALRIAIRIDVMSAHTSSNGPRTRGGATL